MATIQKVRNWKEYNASLKKRGTIIFSYEQKSLPELYYSGRQSKGGKREYSSAMYEYILTVKVMLRLPWRAAAGLVEQLLKYVNFGQEVEIPNYAHANREAGKLNLKIKQYAQITQDGMELAFDSTGVNVYTTSGWHQRKHGKDGIFRNGEQWKKIHIAIDLDTMQIVASDLTNSNVNDCEVVAKMSKEIVVPVKSVRADGAYDTQEFYKIINTWGADPIIPPAKTSKAQDELKKKPKEKKPYLRQRDDAIKMIREHETFEAGLKAWKIKSGYHRRSLVESCMFRLKRTFGFYLQHKKLQNRQNEVIAKINILNQMASYGRAQYSI